MSIKDIIADMKRSIPSPKPYTDAELAALFGKPPARACRCGATFHPRAEETLCGRCLEGLA